MTVDHVNGSVDLVHRICLADVNNLHSYGSQ